MCVYIYICTVCISSVQSLSCVQLFCYSMDAARQASLSITNSWSLLRLMSIESVMPSNHLILLLLPSIFPSMGVFSNESVLCIRSLQSCTFYLFLDVACRILIPCSGIKPALPAMETQSPNHWVNREGPTGYF